MTQDEYWLKVYGFPDHVQKIPDEIQDGIDDRDRYTASLLTAEQLKEFITFPDIRVIRLRQIFLEELLSRK